jgi:DNA helicase-2/ATP-dependent DNA helicase PcrA
VQNILNGLNPVQKEAVETLNGPLLVLAGAGTGKTKVLTSRIVNILEKKLARSGEILAVTFTNKAAKEMKERVEHMLGYPVDGFWIGTFHSIGLRILRRHTTEVGLKPNFSILDTDDCEKIIKEILQNHNLDIKKFPASMVSNLISRLKDKNLMPGKVPPQEDKLIGSITLANIYMEYQTRLRELNTVDFGDLLLLCVDLFRQFPDVLAVWQDRFKFVLIDEFQDTNVLQYIFIRILSMKYNNLCCVGDDDQSIYSWRGAEINNILRFEEDFQGAKVLRLEQNYRSTTPILKTASSLISKNKQRWEKTLWTENEGELPVKLYEGFNSKVEADFIATTIEELLRKGVKYKNMAILVRASFQTREIEERLKFYAIPYRFIGGTEFYNRLEIKDVIAYLRLFYQKYDDMAFLRIINTPKRGIGESSIDKIKITAKDQGLSLFEASRRIIGKKVIPGKAEGELKLFIESFDQWEMQASGQSMSETARMIIESSGYLAMWEAENTMEAKSRIDNIKELCQSLENYGSLEEFLEFVALVSDKEDDSDENKVSVMTLHGAKGLEFDTVFLPGWEEGILPNQRALEETGELGLQEERRLAYVGITRAKKDLYISYSLNRFMYGNWSSAIGSRFLAEFNHDFVEKLGGGAGNSNINANNYQSKNKEFLEKNLFKSYTPNSNFDHAAKAVKKGSQVKHNTIGTGTVINLQGPIAEVQFDDGSVKKIMVSFLKVL